MLLSAAAACRGIITVEEHSVHGGLGEACASVLLENGFNKPFRIIGIPDEYTMAGSQAEIFDHYGITGERIAKTGLHLIKD
jgi:transketolase